MERPKQKNPPSRRLKIRKGNKSLNGVFTSPMYDDYDDPNPI
jgi:hypothetical protein